LGFILLAGVTVYGVHQFLTGDLTSVLTSWRGKGPSLLGAQGVAVLGVVLNGVSWMWLCRVFGIRVWDARGVAIYLSGHAGILLPVHLGNLVRPEAITRLGRGSLGDCLRVEATFFVIDGAAAVVVLAGLGTYLVYPLAAGGAALATAVVLFLTADRLTALLSGTRVTLPDKFWRQWSVLGLLLIGMAQWILHGLALYLVAWDLPGQVGLVETLVAAPLSSCLGVGTGSPGGIGAVEGLLGTGLKIMHVPTAHLALAVAAFRLVTFWVWLPIGWGALVIVNRCGPQRA